jgi:hypothetical protein
MAALDRPRVEYRTPVDLVREVQAGVIRIPTFQRGFKWEAGDVVKLFDSIVRGYPIGDLLLWRRPAEAQRIPVGALVIEAPAIDAALWVVDGQQRIISLVSALVAARTATDSRFRVFLDLTTGEFHTSGPRQTAPASWLPVSTLLDTATLLSWMRRNAEWLTDALIAVADQAAKAIREYQIPTYVVASDDEAVLVDIFARMNTTGKPLTKTEVFQALHAGMSGDEPTDLRSLSRVTAEVGFGALDERLALRCLLAYRGGDIFRDDFHAEFSSDDDRIAAYREVAAALRESAGFLQSVAGIPHIKLLPYSYVMPVLVRFVRLYGPPEGRVALLLRRWIWRGAIDGSLSAANNVLVVRRELSMVDSGNPLAVGSALAQSPRQHPDFTPQLERVHFSHALTKINTLGLLSAEPRDPITGGPLDLASLLEHGSPLRMLVEGSASPLADTIANRLVAPAASPRRLQQCLLGHGASVAAGHLIDTRSLDVLASGDFIGFLDWRVDAVSSAIHLHIRRMAEWGARDGRAVADIMRAA